MCSWTRRQGRVLILLFLHSLAPLSAFSHDVEVDGIYFGFLGTRKACVTFAGDWLTGDDRQSDTYTGEVVVPARIEHGGRTYTVVSVGENAFAGCDRLRSVRLPSSVTAVSACAFLGCSSLREVSLPAGMLVFGSCAFTGCTSLRQITLPRHTELVDTLTLYCCASLASVVLPHRVRKVCQGAFGHLTAMTDLYCYASTPPDAEQGAFSPRDQRQCTLHVPAEALPLYLGSPVWRDFPNVVPLSDKDYAGQGYQRGDINDDGRVDADDLALLRRFIVGLPADAGVRWAADVNADGIVNAVDYVILSKR